MDELRQQSCSQLKPMNLAAVWSGQSVPFQACSFTRTGSGLRGQVHNATVAVLNRIQIHTVIISSCFVAARRWPTGHIPLSDITTIFAV